MKRYLLAGGLSLSLLLAASTTALAQDDADDEGNGNEEEVQSLLDTIAELEATIEALEAELALDAEDDSTDDTEDAVEEDAEADNEDDKGTRQNPYLLGEVGSIAVMTHSYDDHFSTYSGARDDDAVTMMEEEVMEDDVEDSGWISDAETSFDSMMRNMMYPPYYRSQMYEGTVGLEFTEVLRGEEALEYLEERNFYDDYLIEDDLEWAVVNFTFEWVDSEDPNSMYVSNYEFNVFDSTGVSVENYNYYTYFDGMFESSELYVGGIFDGTIAKRVPIDEPFMIRFGDNYMFQHTFFEFDAVE